MIWTTLFRLVGTCNMGISYLGGNRRSMARELRAGCVTFHVERRRLARSRTRVDEYGYTLERLMWV